MNRRMWVALISAVALAAPLPGCTEHSATAPTSAAQLTPDAEYAQLYQRSGDLSAAIQIAGKLTPALRAQLDKLVQDIERWQAKTGSKDITVSEKRHVMTTKAGNGSISAAPRGNGPCHACAPTIPNPWGNGYCYLTYQDCNTCMYQCVFFARFP